MRIVGAGLLSLFLFASPVMAAEQVTIGLLATEGTDLGVAGARLAIEDNNTTGRFTGQSFALDEVRLPPGGDAAQAAKQLEARGHTLVVSLLPADQLLAAAGSGALLLNAAAADERLRGPDCRPNLLHTLPDRAMLADALGQYLLKKRWTRWLLIKGQTPNDEAFAAAVRHTAKRFGAKILDEKTWTFDTDSKPENDVPTFTQGSDYDVVVVADEEGTFGDLLSYRLWLPRPVVGTQGMAPTAWDSTAEAWGATQLQNRFHKLANRPMTAVDYAGWLAVRAVAEAAQRSHSADPKALRKALLDPDFAVAGFKGRQLSFRAWDGQMRQPIFLAAANGVIGLAPVDGFMHPSTDLDTLGTDKPETKCKTGPQP